MKSLITGAGGYIGSALAATLTEVGDELVLQYFRSGSSKLDAMQLRVDLSTDGIEMAQLRGIEVVYHCAGIAHQQAADEEYQRINYTATLKLARRAQAAGVRCFVFLSSIKAEAADTPYGYYKQQTELALQEMSSDAMSIACVRPALVYAETVPGNLASLVSLVRKGLPLPPEKGGRSLIARADLIELMRLIGRQSWSGFECVTATDGEAYSTRRLCLAIRLALGKSNLGIQLPMSAWKIACVTADVLRKDGQPLFEKLFGEDIHSAQMACERFDWQPRFKFEDLVGQMVATQ
jgi:nucleoside-diphosphate-sugar epimerase